MSSSLVATPTQRPCARSPRRHPLHLPLRSTLSALAIAAALAACGGGHHGDDAGAGSADGGAANPTPDPAPNPTPTPDPTPAPTTRTVSGRVIDGPLQGATVCLDVNGNGSCDTTEPVSGPTDAAGRFTIPNLPGTPDPATYQLIANVPATAIDADNPGTPVGTAYVLRSPAGRSDVISPVTTLIAAGIAQGLTTPAAEAAVASQLGVTTGSLYGDYTADRSTPDNQTLSRLAGAIVQTLQQPDPSLEVQVDVGAGYTLAALFGTDADNWRWRAFTFGPSQNGILRYRDARRAQSNGVEVTRDTLYRLATAPSFLAPDGTWKKCDDQYVSYRQLGTPYVGEFCGAGQYSTRTLEDIGGRTMVSVIQTLRADTRLGGAFNLPDAALGTGVFPPGSQLSGRVARVTSEPVQDLDSSSNYPVPVAELPARYPIPPSGAVTTGTSLSVNRLVDNGTVIADARGAFGPNGLMQYYLCTTTAPAVCEAEQQGTWTLTTINGVPAITLTNTPAERSATTPSVRVFIDREGFARPGYRNKLTNEDLYSVRLNQVASDALLDQLGAERPTFP